MTGPNDFSRPFQSAELLARRDIDFLDIKRLNDMAGDHKNRLLALLSAYRAAKQTFTSPTAAVVEKIYAGHEMSVTARQIIDQRALYKAVRRESRILTQEYIRRLNDSCLYSAVYKKAA